MKVASNVWRWLVPSLAVMGLVLAFNSVASRAADGPATAPAAGAKITGTVKSADGPASGATVRLIKASDMPAHGNKAGAAANAADGTPKAGNKIPSVADTTTGADGSFSFDKVADGDYVVMATLKGEGRGHAKVSVVNGANPAALAITLARGQGGKGGNTPAPAN